MYGLVSVQPDGNTINGITYYQHGETPGLGGEIEIQTGQVYLKVKNYLMNKHQPAIRIVKGPSSTR